MGKRTKYGPGTFCWVNLSTTDVNEAKRFYSELLGWEYGDGLADGLSMARRYDADVAAMSAQEEPARAQGTPSHWNNYVSVEDADRLAANAQRLGGAVIEGPIDVSDAGRLAVIADPAGAVVGAWQPRRHFGAGHVNDPGCLTWNDLITNDPGGAIAFYSELFSWRFERMDTGDGPRYWVIDHAAAAMGHNGGMRELSEEESRAGVPPHWLPYFTVDSAASAVAKTESSGGAVLSGPMSLGAGTIAVISDPTGAVLCLFEGEVDE